MIRNSRYTLQRRAALDYAAHGWPVFPLQPGGHLPLVAQGAFAATTRSAQIKRWWRQWPAANIGLDCARAGVVALEVEPRRGGLETWSALNVSARTSTCTSRAGFVLLYALPAGLASMRAGPLPLGAGVTLHGAGVSLVLPPSLLSEGGPVRWLLFNDGWRPSRALRPLPESLLAWLEPVSAGGVRRSTRLRHRMASEE